MGIPVQCPNGHRMRVKDELRGKKGRCPTCGAKFRIEPAADVARPAAIPELPWAREIPLDPAVIATLPRALPFGAVKAAAEAAAAAARAATEPAVAAEAEAPASSSIFDEPPDDPIAEVVDVEEPPRRFAAAIADQPDLTWCIAFPGGDPSEPIDGHTMQDWLDGRQAEGSEVVWRADWPEWLPVRQVFPEYFRR
jgi:hypothetical protein